MSIPDHSDLSTRTRQLDGMTLAERLRTVDELDSPATQARLNLATHWSD